MVVLSLAFNFVQLLDSTSVVQDVKRLHSTFCGVCPMLVTRMN